MRRIAKITGRTDDMLIIRGVNVFPSQIEELILHCRGLAPHYEIEVSRPHRLDEVLVSVEARPELSADAHQSEAALLATKLKALIGITAEIKIVNSGSIRRSTGKAARVNDRRHRDVGKA
jgi:phenylacetate-CoA ligase